MGRIHDRNRRRRFDEARAGAWSRGLAHRRLDAFVRVNVLQLTLFVLGVATLAAGLWLVLSPWAPSRGFALGVFVTGSLAAMYHWCVLASGAVNGTMGAAAEEWTATELRRLRRQGWRTINHLVFRKGDIDHIAIGPDGVIVVETKWKSDDRAVEDDAAWLATAAEQAKRNERDVARFLGWGARRDARITALPTSRPRGSRAARPSRLSSRSLLPGTLSLDANP